MGKPKAPKPPDPKETSSASTSTNIGTAVANAFLGNVNEITPDGRTSVNQTGTYKWTDPYTNKTYDVPTFTRTTTLSPEQQAIARQQNAANLNLSKLANTQSDFLKGYLGNEMSLKGLPQRADVGGIQAPDLQTSYVDDFSNDRQRVEDALFSRLDRKLGQDQGALQSQLANQGIRVGTEAYERAMADFGQNRNDARTSAILSAGQEQSRLAGLSRDQAMFGNSAAQQGYSNEMARAQAMNTNRDSALQELFAARNQPINEITALLSGSQVNQPQFMGANMPTIPTTDVAGLIGENYNQKMGAYNQQMAARQSLFGGLLGLGGSLLMSDERTKENVEPVGELKGHKLFEYNYKADPTKKRHIGVMAQKVEKKRPDAVHTRSDGVKLVDYGALFQAGSKN